MKFCIQWFRKDTRNMDYVWMYSQSTAKIPIGDPKQKSINNGIIIRLEALDEENKNLKANLTAAEDRIEILELENESIKSQLDITDLEIDNLQDKYDLLNSQNKIFESSIETIEARLDILEKNSGMAFTMMMSLTIRKTLSDSLI